MILLSAEVFELNAWSLVEGVGGNIKQTAMTSSNATSAKVFIYMGEGGASIPYDVVRVWVDPSVTSIPAEAFNERRKLKVDRG